MAHSDDVLLSPILVTGATGFIGSAIVGSLRARGRSVRATWFERRPEPSTAGAAWYNVGSIGCDTDWSEALRGVRVVVHTAGRAHVLHPESDALARAEAINVQGTLQLARSAARAGVQRLVFLSSIGVVGDRTTNQPFTERSGLNPHDVYAASKYRAEMGLRAIAMETGLQLVILRPPLVYGPGAPGNFARLVALVRSRLPLPLGGIRNARSFIALENLVDVMMLCVDSSAAEGESFVVCDGQDLSTPALLHLIATGLGVPLHLISIPPRLLTVAGRILRRRDQIDKLCQSLQIDDARIRARLQWQPRVNAMTAVIAASRAFANARAA